MLGISEPAVKSLLIQMLFDDQPLATGTGFIAKSAKGPMLITNRHNVTGIHQQTGKALHKTCGTPNRMKIIHNRQDKLGEWVPRFENLLDDDTPRWIEHPTLGAEADFVALPLTEIDDVDVYPYNLDDTGLGISIGPADSVSVVGFPFGLQAGGSLPIWVTGFVASEPEIDFRNLPQFLIDCRSRKGQSGSPVIAYRSCGDVAMRGGGTIHLIRPVTIFLGIYSGRIHSESDLGIVWKSAAIRELVEAV